MKGDRGSEGGWKMSSGFAAPPTLGTDANYYNGAYWKVIPQKDVKYYIENVVTQRYLFQEGLAISGNRRRRLESGLRIPGMELTQITTTALTGGCSWCSNEAATNLKN